MNNVSIIIPVYNGEKYLKHAIDSALIQDVKEVIVIDDCSKDNTYQIIHSYGNRIKSIYRDKNGGTAAALNDGIKLSSTEWIKWLSADDILKQNAIRNMLKKIKPIPQSYDKIFYTHYDIIDKNNNFKKHFKEPDNSKNQKAVLLDHFYGNGSTSLIHKSIFDRCGLFDETLGYQEDYEFWLRCVLIHNIELHLLDLNTLYYRVHDKQLTELKKGDSIKKSHAIKEMILNQVPEYRILLHSVKPPFKTRIKRKIRRLVYT